MTVNRQLVGHVLISLATFAAGLLMGQGSSDRTLETERIVLREAGGKVRMVLSAREGEAALMLFDASETMRAGLGIVDSEPGLFLYDAARRQRLSVSTLRGAPGLRLYDATEEERAALSAESATPGLMLRAEDGKRLRLGITQDVPGFEIQTPRGLVRRDPSGRGLGLSMHEADGGIRAFLDLTQAGPGLALFDSKGKMRALLDSTDDDPILAMSDGQRIRVSLHVSGTGPSLRLYDAREKGIFSAP